MSHESTVVLRRFAKTMIFQTAKKSMSFVKKIKRSPIAPLRSMDTTRTLYDDARADVNNNM
jgi:hypothetical protein